MSYYISLLLLRYKILRTIYSNRDSSGNRQGQVTPQKDAKYLKTSTTFHIQVRIIDLSYTLSMVRMPTFHRNSYFISKFVFSYSRWPFFQFFGLSSVYLSLCHLENFAKLTFVLKSPKYEDTRIKIRFGIKAKYCFENIPTLQ